MTARNENPPGQGADVEPAPAGKQTTTYIVLRLSEHGTDTEPLWLQLPDEHTVPAGNKKAAIKAATSGLPAEQKSGSFHAVSAATWGDAIPRTVATKEVDDWG